MQPNRSLDKIDSPATEGHSVVTARAQAKIDGGSRLRLSSINLRDRDGLHGRLDSVRCPVLWMQSNADTVYSVANAEDEIPRFVNAAQAELRVVQRICKVLPCKPRRQEGGHWCRAG